MIALTKPFFNQDIIFVLLTISFLLVAILRASFWKHAKLLFMGVFAQRYANRYLREENVFTERVNFITFLLMTINFSLILLKFIPQTSLLEVVFLISGVTLFFILKGKQFQNFRAARKNLSYTMQTYTFCCTR